jgi:transcriptional regulator with XRE-family HTH domain
MPNRPKLQEPSPLRKARLARGMTLEDVVAVVGSNTGNLSRIELGQPPSRELASALATLFKPVINEHHVFYPEQYPGFQLPSLHASA